MAEGRSCFWLISIIESAIRNKRKNIIKIQYKIDYMYQYIPEADIFKG